jgi:hypothetical protein
LKVAVLNAAQQLEGMSYAQLAVVDKLNMWLLIMILQNPLVAGKEAAKSGGELVINEEKNETREERVDSK